MGQKKCFRKGLFVIVVIATFCVNQNVAFLINQAAEYCSLDQYSPAKHCSLRGTFLTQDIWNHWSGMLCYNYTNDSRLKFKYNIKSISLYCSKTGKLSTNIPAFLVNNTTFALFDYTHEKSLTFLKQSFKTDLLYQNYIKCCKEAEDCCANSMTNENIVKTKESCPVVWDAWSCFKTTPVNTTAKMTCSSQAYQSPEGVCTCRNKKATPNDNRFDFTSSLKDCNKTTYSDGKFYISINIIHVESKKECYWNEAQNDANWNQQTDYSPCAIAPVYLKRYRFQVIFLHVCNAFTLPAVIIFVCFKTFRESTRVILHRNLLIALIIRNILTVLSKELVMIDALKSTNVSNNIMEQNTVGCRMLAFFASAATNSIYACMFVDGFYLHKVIVRTFAKDPKLMYLYFIVIILTFLPSLIWATIIGINQRADCWMVDRNNEQWAVDGFRVVILFTNFILLLDIIRVMLSKMKQGGTTRQTKAAFRATLFLIPLFGLHIFITAKKVVINDTCAAEDVYDYFRYSMEASQGIFVAFLFCYANTEVHNEIKNAFRKLNIQLNQKYGWSLDQQSSRRRTTTATYVAANVSQDSF